MDKNNFRYTLIILFFSCINLFSYCQILNTKIILANSAFKTSIAFDSNNNLYLFYSDYDSLTWTVKHNLLKYDEAGNINYSKLIDFSNGLIFDFATSSDGKIALLSGDNSSINILFLDTAGIIIWQKNFQISGLSGAYYAHNLCFSTDGIIYITISSGTFSGIIKLNNFGDITWANSITGYTNCPKCVGFKSIAIGNNGVINTMKDTYSECLIRVDSSGQILWSKSYDDGIYRWPEFIKIIENNNFIVAGNGNGNNSFFQKMDQSGNLLFAKSIQNFSITGLQTSISNDIFLTGIIDSNLTIIKLDSTGELISCKTIDEIKSDYNLSDIFSDFGFNLNFTSLTRDYDVFCTYFTGDLNEFCNTYIPSIIITEDLSFESATIDSIVVSTPLSITTTSDLNTVTNVAPPNEIDFCAPLSQETNNYSNEFNFDFNLYPNPSEGNFTLELNVLSQGAIMNIYDIFGKLILSQNIASSKTQITGLSSGLFIICLRDGDNYVSKKIVVR